MNLLIYKKLAQKIELMKNSRINKKMLVFINQVESANTIQDVLKIPNINKTASSKEIYYTYRLDSDKRLIFIFNKDNENTLIAIDILSYDEISSDTRSDANNNGFQKIVNYITGLNDKLHMLFI